MNLPEDLLQQCTVKLSLPNQMGWGTGFFVAPGWILTCAHVVREAKDQPVHVQWQKQELEAVVERSLPDPYDLALLRVTLTTDAKPPCVYLDEEIRPHDPLYLFGYPDQDFPNGCPVTFSCEGLTGDEPALIKFALGQARPGMSGSPLLNQRTVKVCGIVKFTHDRSFDLGGGAIPTHVILEQFPQLRDLQQEFHGADHRWSDLLEPTSKVDFQTYLKSLITNEKYQRQLRFYRPTDVISRLQESQSATMFDFGLMVQSMQTKREEDAQNLEPQEKTERLPALEAVRKYAAEHVLLLGQAGLGKSTVLLQLLVDEARKALADSSAKIPVLVELRYLDAVYPSVVEQIGAFLRGHDLSVDEATLRTALAEERLLLLIDGIDELPPETARLAVAQFRQDYPQTPMIFTKRDLEIGGDMGIEKKLEMQPLTEQQAQQLLQSYFPDQGDFFDRKEVLATIFERLRMGRHICIFGEPGIGKTTLLKHICTIGPDVLDRSSSDFVSLDMQLLQSTTDFFNVLCKRLDLPTLRGYELVDALVDRQIILCLDEFGRVAQEGFTNDFLIELRGLACSGLFIFAVASRLPLLNLLKNSSPLVSPLSNIFSSVEIEPFSPDLSHEFIINRLENTGISFEESEIAKIVEVSEGKPFLLNQLVDSFYRRKTENEFDSTSSSKTIASSVVSYGVKILLSPVLISVGNELEVIIQIIETGDTDSEVHLIEIPRNDVVGSDINIFLTAPPGFLVNGDNAKSLPLDSDINRRTVEGNSLPTACFRLIALRPGFATIETEIYCGEIFKTTLETIVQVAQFNVREVQLVNTARSRPVPQPDLILQVQTVWNENLSNCTFRYHLDSFHPRLPFASEIEQRSETLTSGWLRQTHSLLETTLEDVANSLPEDFRSRLASLGQYLFQQLLPLELQNTFRSVMRFNQPFTLLILADQDAGLPWELLHDGQSFWGERFIIGCWSWELDRTRPYEFAIGAVNVAYYADVEHPGQWASLLEPSGAPPPMMQRGGMLADLSALDAMRGLHLLRRGKSFDEIERQNAPVPFDRNGTADLEQELQPAKLSLRRNRPLVTLGYVSAGLAELTTLEQTWAPTFIRSGCSAFVGPLWAVQPAVEASFISSFYHRLWAGDSLGMAFQAGRRAARSLVPDSLDWMAYTLFGDPMARPYRPSEGKGYAVVEPIGQEITDPIAPGSSVRFRVSLRRTPPVWYDNRLMDVAEDLTFNELQIYIIASGLQVTPAESIGMQRTPTGGYLGWFTLMVPSTFAGDSALVQVHFEDGIEPIHSLRFLLTVGNTEGEQR